MNLDAIATKLSAGMKASARMQQLLPGSTVMAGGEHAQETAFLNELSLSQARALASLLGAVELRFTAHADYVSYAPAEVMPENAFPAGNIVIELLENDDSRFAHFWIELPHGRIKVIAQLLPDEGPQMTVRRGNQRSMRGQIVHSDVAVLSDDGSGASFMRNGFEVIRGREAQGHAYWSPRH
jgi:hypothetical protein